MSFQTIFHQQDEQSRLIYPSLMDGADQKSSPALFNVKPWHVVTSRDLIVMAQPDQISIPKNISFREESSSIAALQIEFSNLTKEWRKERGITSSITQMAMCNSYQRIIGMGRKAVPLILKQLKNEGDNPDHWFWALLAITGENPVSSENQGDMKRMAKDWIDWGSAKYGG